MAWLTTLWASIKVAFASGILWKALFVALKTLIVSVALNKEVQKKAYELALELRQNTDLTGLQKAVEFNKQMAKYLAEKGIVTKESVINFLRELACLVIKAKEEKGELPPVEKKAQ